MAADEIKDTTVKAVEGVVGAAQEAAATTQEAVVEAVQSTRKAATKAASTSKKAATKAAADTEKAVKQAVSSSKKAAEKAAVKTKKAATKAAATSKKAAGEVVGSVEAAVGKSPVGEALDEFIDHQKKALEEAGKALESLIPEGVRTHGKSAVEEMLSGYRSLFNSIVDEVEATVKKVVPTSDKKAEPDDKA